MFPIILHLMTSPFLRFRIITSQLIEDLSFYLSTVEELTFLAPEEFKSTLLLILEAISQNPAILVPETSSTLQHLLPTILNLLQSSNGDTRFLCLKIFIDVLSEFLSHPNLYSVRAILRSWLLTTHRHQESPLQPNRLMKLSQNCYPISSKFCVMKIPFHLLG